MKRLIPALFVAFLGLLNMISCSKDDPISKGFITPGTSQSISLEAGAASSEFVFSTNSNWTAKASESWLSVSPSSGGAGENIKLKVSAGENTQYEERSATVTISVGDATQTLTVQQASKKGFEISQTSFSIGKDGGNVNIPVKANASYTCTVSESAKSWLSVTQLKSLTDYTIVLSASKNETYDTREGTVTIAYENQTSTVTVTQSQNEEIILTQKEFDIDSKGGELRIPVTTNIEYACSVMEGAKDWITITKSQTKGLEEYSIILQVAENVSYTGRVGQIKVTGAGKESFITITQGSKGGFEITKTDFSIGKDGGNINIPIKANVSYTCTVSESAKSWLSVIQLKSLTDYTIVLSASKNETYDARTGTVTIAYENQTSTVTVTQSQNEEVIVTQKEFDIDSKGGELRIPVTTNIEYACSVMEGAQDWITITKNQTRGLEEYSIVLQVAENGGYTGRVGQIKVTGADKESFITITQDISDEIKTMYQKERASLLALFNYLNGNQWIKKENWGSDKPLGEWHGVTTDEHGFVVRLSLPENNLSGTIPPEIGDLTKLKGLELGYNIGIDGVIPPEIGKLKTLEALNLYGNDLTGGIPEELFSLSELGHLDLGDNNLSGELSPKIAQLSKLNNLFLHWNKFTGPLPSSMGQMSNLRQVFLYNNSFSGSLPDELGSLNNLEAFRIGANELSGTIPISILNNPNIWQKFWADIIAWNNFDITNLTYFIAPTFTLKDVTGSTINLGQEYSSNKYTVLYLWQSWCSYASEFHPKLISLYNQYKSKGLDVIGYSTKDHIYDEMGMTDQKLKEIADNLGMPWRTIYLTGQYQDAWSSMMSQGGSPTIHVVDQKGNMVFSTYAFSQSRNDLEAFLKEKLGEGSEHNYYASTDYSADGKVKTIQTHTAGEGIKLVFTGDAFTDKEHAAGTFDTKVEQAIEAFFSEEPYTSLRNRFDVYSVAAVSKNKEIMEDSETAFGTFFGAGTKVGGNDDKVFEYALKVPGVDMTKTLVTVIVNSPNYSGTCNMYEDNAAIGYCAITGFSESEFAKLIRHECGGHGFGKLLDEYAYSGTISADEKNEFIRRRDNLGWGANVDVTSDPAKIQWSFMLSDTRYKDVVGVYEGGLTYAHGAWRPTYNSIMHMNTGGFNAPSRFAIYKRIIHLSEGKEATFDEFAQFDAPNLARIPTKAVSTAKADSFEPLAPPVFIKGSWKDARK